LGVEAIILNDFTRADIIARCKGSANKWLRIQLKTTRSHVIGKPNCWQFDHVKSYSDMVVVCLVGDDNDRCWLYDGVYLDTIKPENVVITPLGKHEVAALKHGSRDVVTRAILSMCLVIKGESNLEFCKMFVEKSTSAPFLKAWSEFDCRMDFASTAHAREYELIAMFKTRVCDVTGWLVKWPSGQSLPYDIVMSQDCGASWLRVQVKSTSARKVSSGFRGKLSKSAGMHDGTKKRRPYSIGDADAYVFLRHVQTGDEHTLDVWGFLEKELDGSEHSCTHISSPTKTGSGYITLHLPHHLLGSKDLKPCTMICGNGGSVSKNRWTAQNHKRFEW
jgi:hypothetical protein